MRRTPALILGGGPAGAAAAIGLARAGAEHLLLERTHETGDALCGGFLSWRTLERLGALGIEADALNRQAVTRTRLFAGDRVSEASLPRPARGVSRRRLDTLMLAQATRLGARIERGVSVREAGPDSARLADGTTLAADTLFLASGKHEIRGLARGVMPAADPTLGLRIRLGPAPALARMVGDAIELHLFAFGYAGLVLQEDGTANLCLAVHRSRLHAAGSPQALLQELAREAPMLGERLAYAAGPVDAVANVPYGWRATRGTAGLFRLGDQAGVIPSLAGEGMGIAVASGMRAAAAYLAGGKPAAIPFQRGFARDLARPLALAGVLWRAAERPALARAAVATLGIVPGLTAALARATRLPPFDPARQAATARL